AREAGCEAMTLAKLLDGATPMPPAGTTMLLDEAGMASTDDLDRLVALGTRHGWRLVCVGDPHQLPAVGRGGMFAHWCEVLPAVRLRDRSRVFAGDRVATRRNDPTLVSSAGGSVRNRQTWTVRVVGDDGSLVVEERDRGSLTLPAAYVARDVELGWAVTGHGNQ